MASEDDGGLSTPQKIVAGTALGVPTPAAVGVARKLMSDGNDNDDGLSTGGGRSTSRRKSSPARSKASTARGKSSSARKKATAAGRKKATTAGRKRATGTRKTASKGKSTAKSAAKKSSSRKR